MKVPKSTTHNLPTFTYSLTVPDSLSSLPYSCHVLYGAHSTARLLHRSTSRIIHRAYYQQHAFSGQTGKTRGPNKRLRVCITLLEIHQHTNGRREIKVEALSIASPDSKQQRLLNSLESPLIKAEDINLPRFRSHSTTNKDAARETYRAVRERRKTVFSSDDDKSDHRSDRDDNDDKDLGYPEPEPETEQDPEAEPEQEAEVETETVQTTRTKTVKRESSEEVAPAKRRRGRPRREEQEKKVREVTRRSRRIVENPSLRKAPPPEPASHTALPKPLRAIGLAQLLQHGSSASNALSLVKNANGKQRALTVDAERIYTASSRGRRFNLTTLDVLKQLVDEHSTRRGANTIISEEAVLGEFKAHLAYHLNHLQDLHASIIDICHDIAGVQRRKNDTRRKILELKKQHTDVGGELSKVRKVYADTKQEHTDFMQMVGSLRQLKNAVDGSSAPGDLSAQVMSELADAARVVDPKHGVQAQLRTVNRELAERLQ